MANEYFKANIHYRGMSLVDDISNSVENVRILTEFDKQ